MFAKNRNINDLTKECVKLRKKGDSASKRQLAKSLTELALVYQKEQFSHEEVISTATEALCIFEEVTANYDCITRLHRVLAEVLAEDKGRKKDALEHAKQYLITAQESGDHAQIQLAFHVNAWVRERIWISSGKKPSDCKDLLNEALEWCEKSIAYIREHGRQFTKDAIKEAGSPGDRKANVERLASGLAGTLENREVAEKYWKSANKYASNLAAKGEKQKELQFELRMTQLDWSWVDKKKVAGKLVELAPAKKKGIALFEQSQVLIYEGLFSQAYNKLREIYGQHSKGLSEDEKVILTNRLIFAHRMNKADERLQEETSKKEKRRACEKKGDRILTYEPDNQKILGLALEYYQDMLSYSVSNEEKISACTSVARTYLDLKNYDRAMDNFKECLKCEQNAGKPADKLLGTRICIFDCKCKGKLVTKHELEEEFHVLDKEVPPTMPSLKTDLYTYMAEGMKNFGDDSAKEYKREADRWKVKIEDGEEEEDEEQSQASTEDEESDSEIIRNCEREIREMNDEEYIKKRVNIKNIHGETDLHDAARGNDTNRLLKLLKHKYKVNARDNGGWTPLHEAVSHGKENHVKILLKANANVECASSEGFNEDTTGGGITPLMDVLADMNNVEKSVLTSLNIARALFDKKPPQIVKKCTQGSVSIKDAHEWTPIDLLRDAMENFDEDDSVHMPMAKKLLQDMEMEMKKAGVPLRVGPLPVRPKEKSGEFKQRHQKRAAAPKRPGVDDYKSVMNHFRRRVQGNCDNDDMDVEDHDDAMEDDDTFGDFGTPPRQDTSPRRRDAYQSDDDELPSERQETPPPRSAPRPRTSTQISSRNLMDDFIEDDIGALRKSGKKRKSAEVHSQRPKRMSRVDSGERNATNEEENFSPPLSPVLVRTQSVKRRSSTQTPSSHVAAPKTTPVHVFFVIPEGGTAINPTIVQLSTVADLHERCATELPLQYRNFDITFRDSKLDEGFSLSILNTGKEEKECCGFPHLKCVVKKALPVEIFKGYDPAYQKETTILEQLEKLSLSEGALDVSRIEVDFCIQNILRSVDESAARLKVLNISTCDILETNCRALAPVLQRCDEFIAQAVNMNDLYVDQLVATGFTFPSIAVLDLSDNIISGQGLMKLLGLMPSLVNVTIRGLDLSDAGVEMAGALKGLKNLITLNIHNTKMAPATLEAVSAECDQLESIFVGGLDLDFSFSVSWLPKLRLFVAPGCKILNWESFLDWVSLISSLERIDLSCTDISIDHVMDLCDRFGTERDTRPLTMRLVRCPKIETHWKSLEEAMLRLMEDRHSVPLRLRLAETVERELRLDTAHATQFLADSF